MKIAYDHQIFCWQPFGGISRYFKNLALDLNDLNEDVKIFAGLHRNHYLLNLPEKIVSGLKLPFYPPKSARAFQFLNHNITSRKIKKWNPDILHETYYSVFQKNKSKAKKVITIHDMTHELFPEMFSRFDNSRVWKKNAIKRADHIICISNNTKNDLLNIYNLNENDISVVHHGYKSLTVDDSFSSLSEINKLKPFLLFVGHRSGYKNFNNFIKGFSESRRLMQDFDILCFGGGKFSEAEILTMKSLGFRDAQVRYVSGSDAELSFFYYQSRAFIYPSLYEGFGFPLLEAMAFNCPIIASNAGSIPEVAGDAALYFDPNSSDDICQKIEQLVYSDDLIRSIKLIAKQQLLKFNSFECAKKTLSVYKSLISY